MNCQEFYQNIDEYIANGLNNEFADTARLHLNTCTACQRRVKNRLQLQISLADMPFPEMRGEFTNQVIQNAIQANSQINRPASSSLQLPKFRWGFAAGFTTALATSFAIWFFVNTYSTTPENFRGQSIQALNIELHESKTVKIVFKSPQAMNNATVSLVLPKHIELEGYAKRRSLTWSTKIKAGKNVLSLPVRALDIGNGELVTKVEYGGKSKMIRFNVNVNQIHQSKPIKTTDMPSENYPEGKGIAA